MLSPKNFLGLAAVLPRHLRVQLDHCAVHIEPLRGAPDKARVSLDVAVDAALPLWQSAVTTLQQWLSSQAGGRFALHVELADRFVRYQHMPWRAGLNARERVAFAAHRYQDVFGEVAAHWHIALSDAIPGQASLACAIDKTLLVALQQLDPRAQLLSMQGALVAAYQQQRKHIKSESFGFAHVEAERISLLWMRNGHPRAVRSEFHDQAWPQALADMDRRLRMSIDTSMGGAEQDAVKTPLYVCGDIKAAAAPGEIGQQSVHVLAVRK